MAVRMRRRVGWGHGLATVIVAGGLLLVSCGTPSPSGDQGSTVPATAPTTVTVPTTTSTSSSTSTSVEPTTTTIPTTTIPTTTISTTTISTATTSTTSPTSTTRPPTTTTRTTAPTTTKAPTTTTSTTAPTTTAPAARAVAVWRGPTDRPVVALTFDAGSDAGATEAILATLRAEGVTASFGLTGQWVERYPDLAKAIVAAGHQVVNHTYDHRSFTGRSTGTTALDHAQRVSELQRAEAVIKAVTGATAAPWFRPPYGDLDDAAYVDVASAGYRYVAMWTVDSLGWKGTAADAVVTRCLSAAVPGTIYLMHVGSASTDAQALSAVISGLKAKGYGFVTLGQLVG